jgi:hypothetical protein
MIKEINAVRCVCREVQGKYKNKNFEIHIAPVWYNCHVFCDGKEITNVKTIVIVMKAGELTQLQMLMLDY